MDQNIALKLKEEQVKKILREHPRFKYFTVKNGDILKDLDRKVLFGSEAREHIAKDLSKTLYNKDKVELLQKRYGLPLAKAKELVDAFKAKGMDEFEVRKRFRWLREKHVDGYLTPTIEKKAFGLIRAGEPLKKVGKIIRRDQTIYHRRVASGFKNYAGELREGRFAMRADRRASALDKVLTAGTGEIQRRKALGLSYGGSMVSALSGDPEKTAGLTMQGGAATAVDTEAHGVVAAIGSKQTQSKSPGLKTGIPTPLGGNPSSAGNRQPPIGFSRKS